MVGVVVVVAMVGFEIAVKEATKAFRIFLNFIPVVVSVRLLALILAGAQGSVQMSIGTGKRYNSCSANSDSGMMAMVQQLACGETSRVNGEDRDRKSVV